jgi:flagellar protein FlaG
MDIKPTAATLLMPQQTQAAAASAFPLQQTSTDNSTKAIGAETARVMAEKQEKQQENLQEIVDSANKNLGVINDSLVFNLNQDLDRVVVQLVDISSQEIIRQYPSEDMVDIYTALRQLNDVMLPRTNPGSDIASDAASGVLLKDSA